MQTKANYDRWDVAHYIHETSELWKTSNLLTTGIHSFVHANNLTLDFLASGIRCPRESFWIFFGRTSRCRK